MAAAAESRHEREALFHVESAELLPQRHVKTPFAALLMDSRAMVAFAADHQAAVLPPVDWVRWTATAESTLREIDARARKELKATRLVIVLTGRTSDRTRKELADRGSKLPPA